MGRGSGVFKTGQPEQPAGDEPEGSGNGPSDPGSNGPSEPGSNGPSEPGSRVTKAIGPANKKVIGLAAAAVAVAVAGGIVALTQQGGSNSSLPGMPPSTGPMKVENVLPAIGTSQVDGAGPVSVSFTDPVASGSPMPTLSPAVAGSWSSDGDVLIFTPSTPFPPSTKVTVSVPSGPDGIRATNGSLLTQTFTDHFTTGTYSQLGLAVILSQLGYLPMTWVAADSGAERGQLSQVGPAGETEAGMAYDPPAGTFYLDAGYPSSLASLWSPGQGNVILRGAVMAFEAQHNMATTGNLTTGLWNALFKAVASGQDNKVGYTYAVADQNDPETLTIYHNGQQVMQSAANTGIPASPTVNGTFPVYEKFRFQIMSGTNPDGSSYADPVSFVSYFNGGDAVHYFPRGSYGFQQSLGCVELPYSAAEQAYPYLTLGSLVTVTG
jgi:L,D-transpeptidase catalytic domain/Bacterial Ig-like domain